MTLHFFGMRNLCKNFVNSVRNFRSIAACLKEDPSPKKLNQTSQQKVSSSIYSNSKACVGLRSVSDTRNSKAFGDVHKSHVLMTFVASPLFLNQISKTLTFQQVSRFSTTNQCLQSNKDYDMPGSKGVFKGQDCPGGVYRHKYPTGVCPVMPPCLKFVRPPGKRLKYEKDKMECGRICMPCCPKARYPPVCFFPTVKPPCCKIPNPRPAFSECDKECVRERSICDCCHIKPPPCRLLPDIDETC